MPDMLAAGMQLDLPAIQTPCHMRNNRVKRMQNILLISPVQGDISEIKKFYIKYPFMKNTYANFIMQSHNAIKSRTDHQKIVKCSVLHYLIVIMPFYIL